MYRLNAPCIHKYTFCIVLGIYRLQISNQKNYDRPSLSTWEIYECVVFMHNVVVLPPFEICDVYAITHMGNMYTYGKAGKIIVRMPLTYYIDMLINAKTTCRSK